MSLLLPFSGAGGGVIPPVVQPPYLGDAYLYDSPSGSLGSGTVFPGPNQGSPSGTVAGGTILPGPNQGSATGSTSGGTVQPDPNQGSATGSTTGGTILDPDQVYD